MSHFQDSLFSNCGQIIKTKRYFLKTESKSALLFVQTQHLIIYFCQSLLGSGQGRQHPASVGRQTHLKKGKHARTHAPQSASDSLRTVATMVTLKLNSASAAKSPMLLHARADRRAVVCWGDICPPSRSVSHQPFSNRSTVSPHRAPIVLHCCVSH